MYLPGHIDDFNDTTKDDIFNTMCIDPSPEVRYKCDNEYLIELIELLNKKYNEKNME